MTSLTHLFISFSIAAGIWALVRIITELMRPK